MDTVNPISDILVNGLFVTMITTEIMEAKETVS